MMLPNLGLAILISGMLFAGLSLLLLMVLCYISYLDNQIEKAKAKHEAAKKIPVASEQPAATPAASDTRERIPIEEITDWTNSTLV